MSEKLEDYLKIMNESGFFLQMRVAKEAREVFDLVEEEIAFEHGEETSKLDVLAEISYDNFRAFVFMECKRHLHDYNSWVFFRPNVMRKPPSPYILGFGVFKPNDVIDIFYSSSVSNKSGSALNLALVPYPFSELGSLEVGNIGIEVKLSASKHRMEELTKVSKDIVIATHGMAMEIVKRARGSSEETVLFIPVIVTTAKLLSAKADVSKVALNDGRLSKGGLELKELPWIVYEYSLTARLLLPVNTGSSRWNSEREDNLRRRHILIVNSESLKDFFEKLKGSLRF